MKALLINPVTQRTEEIEVPRGDWRAIQKLVGGIFDYFVLRNESGDPLALVYCADNAAHLSRPNVFAFPEAAILEDGKLHFNHPIVGIGVLLAFDGKMTDAYSLGLRDVVGPIHFFNERRQAQTDTSYRSLPSSGLDYLNDKLWLKQQSEMLDSAFNSPAKAAKLLSMIAGHSPKSEQSRSQGVSDPTPRTSYADRAAREFIPRPVGTFSSKRCSVAELEAAFLGFHEWLRKGSRAADHPILAGAFEAPPFFFPDGLHPTNEEFQAGVDVEAGMLSLPFPMEAFWIVCWDMWIAKGSAGEGPLLLYVQQREDGFSTVETLCERGAEYNIGLVQEHARLRQVPFSLVTALHRLNNRRFLIERGVSTVELQRVNAGRQKSKRGLAPLPSFICVTGRVSVGTPQVSKQTGIERCRHDRRSHWRKRRNGVELQPCDWVRVRASTIHPEKAAAPRNPYVVV